MNWMHLFEPHILDRGVEYCEDDHVSEFKVSDSRIEAVVDGSDYYQVSIDLDGEEVVGMSCDCPYAKKGYNCKHMAAVLCKYEAHLADEGVISPLAIEEPRDLMRTPAPDLRQQVESLVDMIPEEDSRDLLIRLLMADDQLRNRLQAVYDFKMTAQYKADLKKELSAILRHYGGRDGYIDWNHAYDFCNDLISFLDDKIPLLMDHNCYLEAFELINIVFYEAATTDMDDSDGGSGMIADTCYDYWRAIVSEAPEEDVSEIRRWFLTRRKSNYVIDYMQDYIDGFFDQYLLSEEEILEQMTVLDQLLSESNDKTDPGTIYITGLGYRDVFLQRLEYMRQLHIPEAEIMAFRSEHRHYSCVRELEIEEALEADEKYLAIQLLVESKELDKEHAIKVKQYSEQLIDLYKELDEKDHYKSELLFQLLNCYQVDLTYYNQLKSCRHSKAEWNELTDSILKVSTNPYFICDVLAQESRDEQLMHLIEEKKDISLLERYEKQLRKAFPQNVIHLYADYVISRMEHAGDRKQYRRLVQYLKKIDKCASGKDETAKIAQRWRLEYRRRTALMDELKNAGY